MEENIITIEELFGTLQQSVVASWRKHLRTAKYSKHIALDEFYKEMPELVDKLIEDWMGANSKKLNGFENIIQSRNLNTLKYLKELKSICKKGYSLMNDEPDLKADLDDIVGLIDSTLYKVKELTESRISLADYINESMSQLCESQNLFRNEKEVLKYLKTVKKWNNVRNWEKIDPGVDEDYYELEINVVNFVCDSIEESLDYNDSLDNDWLQDARDYIINAMEGDPDNIEGWIENVWFTDIDDIFTIFNSAWHEATGKPDLFE